MPICKYELFPTSDHLGYLSVDYKICLFRIPFWTEVMDLIRENGGGYKLVPLCPVSYPYENIMCLFF